MNIRPSALVQRRAIAIFIVLAMLVAPFCASVCGSRECANLSSTQSEDCHGSLAPNDAAPRTGVAAIRLCGLQEFPAVALKEPTKSPDPIKKDSAVRASLNFVQAQSVQLAVSDACYSRADNESCITSSSVRPAVLRI
jgi:hypothetical protein